MALVVAPPAHCVAVVPQAAGVVESCGDLGEDAVGLRALTPVPNHVGVPLGYLAAPAGSGPVVADPAGVIFPRGYRQVVTLRHVELATVVPQPPPPALDVGLGIQGAGVLPPQVDLAIGTGKHALIDGHLLVPPTGQATLRIQRPSVHTRRHDLVHHARGHVVDARLGRTPADQIATLQNAARVVVPGGHLDQRIVRRIRPVVPVFGAPAENGAVCVQHTRRAKPDVERVEGPGGRIGGVRTGPPPARDLASFVQRAAVFVAGSHMHPVRGRGYLHAAHHRHTHGQTHQRRSQPSRFADWPGGTPGADAGARDATLIRRMLRTHRCLPSGHGARGRATNPPHPAGSAGPRRGSPRCRWWSVARTSRPPDWWPSTRRRSLHRRYAR